MVIFLGELLVLIIFIGNAHRNAYAGRSSHPSGMDAAEVISSHGLFDIPHQQVHLRSSIIYIDHDVIHRQKRNAHISARESLFSLLMTADTEDRHPYAHHQHVSTMYTSSVDDVNSDDRSNSAVGGEDERKGSDDCDDNFSAALHPALGPIQASVSEIMSPSSSLLSVTALNLTHLAMHNQTTTNRQWLVHLKTPITQHIKDRVNAAIEPYTLGQYVPHNTFVVVGPNDFSFFNTLSRAPRVLHVTTYHHAFKPSPELMRGVYDNHYQQQQQQQRQRPHPHPLDQPQNKEDREYNNGADRAESQEYHSHENGDASNKVIINSTSNGVFSNSTNHDGGGRGGGGDNVTAEGEKTVVLLVRLSAEYYTSKTQVEELCQIWMSLFNACTNCTTNADTEDQQQQRRQGASLAAPASSTALVITALGEQLMQASVPLSILTHAVVFLSQRHEVHFLEQKKEFELQNKHAQWIIQSDEAGHTTFFDHRLDGQGEVVLIGDTGIDYDSCFFHDPDHAVPVGSHGAHTVNMKHRKIVMYINTADSKDEKGGHGTHVATTLVGSVLPNANSNADTDAGTEGKSESDRSKLSKYNGMAPGAKLAFFDLKDNSPELLVPNNVYDDFYLLAQQRADSHISSNSWGAPDGLYGSYSYDTDRYVWDNKDFVPVFAAGNYGGKGFYTVTSPGIAKNVLTVGASKSSSGSFADIGVTSGVRITAPASIARVYEVVPAAFGYHYADVRLDDIQLVVASPRTACSKPTNGDQWEGKVVLVERGDCYFTEKARLVEKYDGLMMICYNTEGGESITMDAEGDNNDIVIPSVMISNAEGEAIVKAYSRSSTIVVSAPAEFDDPNFNEHLLAPFSSRGPTFDGRLKPDIVAPGMYIMSAHSDGKIDSFTCDYPGDLVEMQGTSMATPVVAGAAAIVRQYFLDGYYPSMSKTQGDAFEPSAATVRAVLINSGQSLGGKVMTTGSDKPDDVVQPPSVFQGYGRILLGDALPLSKTDDDGDGDGDDKSSINGESDSSSSNLRLFVEEGKISDTGLVESFCFRMDKHALASVGDSERAIRATLAWTDPPASSQAAVLLVNNLDLFSVETSTRAVYIGNSHHQHIGRQERVDHTPWDYMNNIEQVSLNKQDLQTMEEVFTVHVRGTHVPHGEQPFSLVVNGFFDHLLPSDPLCQAARASIVCPNNCGNAIDGVGVGAGAGAGAGADADVNTGFNRNGTNGSGNHSASEGTSTADTNDNASIRGVCNHQTGLCECTGDYTGSDCSVKSQFLRVEATDSGSPYASLSTSVNSDEWKYYHFEITEIADGMGIEVLLNMESKIGDPDIYISYESFPTLQSFDYASTVCEPCGDKSRVLIPWGQVKYGTYRIGVHEYCCESSKFELRVGPTSDGALFVVSFEGLVSIMVVGAASLLLFIAVMLYRKHRERSVPSLFSFSFSFSWPALPRPWLPEWRGGRGDGGRGEGEGRNGGLGRGGNRQHEPLQLTGLHAASDAPVYAHAPSMDGDSSIDSHQYFSGNTVRKGEGDNAAGDESLDSLSSSIDDDCVSNSSPQFVMLSVDEDTESVGMSSMNPKLLAELKASRALRLKRERERSASPHLVAEKKTGDEKTMKVKSKGKKKKRKKKPEGKKQGEMNVERE